MMRTNCVHKIIALYITVIFLFTTTVTAAPSSYSIKVPEENGKVKQRYKGTSEKLVIHIQDAHSSFDAQKNLAKIIHSLLPQIGTSEVRSQKSDDKKLTSDLQYLTSEPFIGVEGAIGTVDVSAFRQFPLEEVREKVGQAFVKEGIFSGSELAAISSQNEIGLWGLENTALFEKNFRAFYAVAMRQGELEQEIERLEGYLNLLKEALYNDELKAFDQEASFYEIKQGHLMNFVGTLYKGIDNGDIDIMRYLQLLQFKEVFMLERMIHFDILEEEIERLSEVLLSYYEKSGSLHAGEIKNYYKQYKDKEVNQKTICNYFYSLAVKENLVQGQYLNLTKAVIYWRKFAMVDIGEVMNEVRTASNEVRMHLAQNDDERLLIKTWEKIVHLKQLVALQAIKEDVAFFRTHKEEYAFDTIINDIRRLALRSQLNLDVKQSPMDMDAVLDRVDTFYALAEARDHAMLDNLIKKMDEGGQSVGVLVAGGYHSSGIVDLLKKRDMSYVTVIPSISSVEKDVAYMDRMLGKIAPLSPHLVSHFNYSKFTALLQSIADKGYLDTLSERFMDGAIVETASNIDLAARLVLENRARDELAQAIFEKAEELARDVEEQGVLEPVDTEKPVEELVEKIKLNVDLSSYSAAIIQVLQKPQTPPGYGTQINVKMAYRKIFRNEKFRNKVLQYAEQVDPIIKNSIKSTTWLDEVSDGEQCGLFEIVLDENIPAGAEVREEKGVLRIAIDVRSLKNKLQMLTDDKLRLIVLQSVLAHELVEGYLLRPVKNIQNKHKKIAHLLAVLVERKILEGTLLLKDERKKVRQFLRMLNREAIENDSENIFKYTEGRGKTAMEGFQKALKKVRWWMKEKSIADIETIKTKESEISNANILQVLHHLLGKISFSELMATNPSVVNYIANGGFPGELDNNPGFYRDHDLIGVRKFAPPKADNDNIPYLISQLLSWIADQEKSISDIKDLKEKRKKIIAVAAQVHYLIALIHPFVDGSGRVARLMTNYIIEKNGFEIIRASREDYELAFRNADVMVFEKEQENNLREMTFSDLLELISKPGTLNHFEDFLSQSINKQIAEAPFEMLDGEKEGLAFTILVNNRTVTTQQLREWITQEQTNSQLNKAFAQFVNTKMIPMDAALDISLEEFVTFLKGFPVELLRELEKMRLDTPEDRVGLNWGDANVDYSSRGRVSRSSADDIIPKEGVIEVERDYVIEDGALLGINIADGEEDPRLEGRHYDALGIKGKIVSIDTLRKNQDTVNALGLALDNIKGPYAGYVGEFKDESGIIVIVDTDEKTQQFEHYDNGIIIVPYNVIEAAVTDEHQRTNLEEKLYHEFFHESEEVNEMVRNIIQMHFRKLTEKDGTVREDIREYVEEMLLEYRNKRKLLAKDAIARDTLLKDFAFPEGTKNHDIALHHAIREVEERAARSEYKYFNATEAKQLFALSNFLTSRDMQNRLQLACAIMEVFESDMHRDKQYLFAIEGLTGLTPQDHINDRVSLINRVKLSGKKKDFIIGVAENLQTDAVLRDMIDGIVEKTRMPDITITLEDYNEAGMYDLVLAQKNDVIYDNGKNRTVAFSDKTEESAIEIQIFGNVFVRLLNMIFEKPFDGREVEQFLGRCCIFDINGIVSFKGTMLAEAAQNEIVQEVRNKIIRVAA